MATVEVTITDQGVFYQCGPDLVPISCQWFALCTRWAVTTQSHPTLGDVPICGRCRDKIATIQHDRGTP
jgi:hypothetical protein